MENETGDHPPKGRVTHRNRNNPLGANLVVVDRRKRGHGHLQAQT